ncbi:MAG TPA: hypothetical protein VGT41_05090 [Candidatus Babeliales bacterium]|nr:hypothetical protein [Candidatus Babeliales bacterium]
MKNTIKYLLLGLTLATNQLYPAAAARDVAAQEEEQKDTRAAIELSLQDPEEVRAHQIREERLAKFQKKTEQQIKANRAKKLGRRQQEEGAAAAAQAEPGIVGLDEPYEEELDAAIAASLQEAGAPQEETKEIAESHTPQRAKARKARSPQEQEEDRQLYQRHLEMLEKVRQEDKAARERRGERPIKYKEQAIIGHLPNVLGNRIEAMAQPIRVFETNSAGLINSVIIEGDGESMGAISPDSTFIVTITSYGLVYIRDSSTGKILHEPIEHKTIGKIIISKNNLIAIVSGNTADVWDGNTGTFKYNLIGHTNTIRDIAFSNDNQFIVTGSSDNTARVWNTADGTLRHILTGHTRAITSVAISPDNMFIVTGSYDGMARVWDPSTGTVMIDADTGLYIPTLEGNHRIYRVAISSNNKFIATGSDEGLTHIWDAHTGDLIRQLNERYSGPITSIAISPNNQFIAIGSNDAGIVRVWDTNNGALMHELIGHDDDIYSVAISSNNELIITNGRDYKARIWDANTGQLLHTLRDPDGGILSAFISPDMQFIVTTARSHKTTEDITRIWRAKPVPAIAAHARIIEALITQAHRLLDQAKRIKEFPIERIHAVQGYINQIETADTLSQEQIDTIRKLIETEFQLGKQEANGK